MARTPFDVAAILTVMGATASLLVIGIDWITRRAGFVRDIVRFIAGVDFHATLMEGMRSFLLFAGALHGDWSEMRPAPIRSPPSGS